MNTLKKKDPLVSDYDNGRILIEDFRYYQYAMIEYFLETCVKYISSMNPSHMVFHKIEVEEVMTYSGLANNELVKYTVFAKVLNESKEFFRIFIPKLVYNNFYFLNGNNYIPLLYVIDKPIIIKEKSINLSSLFSSITINFDSGLCIFTGRNLDLSIFVSIFLLDDDSDETKEISNNINLVTDVKKIITYFNNSFNESFTTVVEIKKHIEKLFFDEYTKYLYNACYFEHEDIKISNLTDIIKISLTMYFSGKIFDFIDLKNKRLSFIELMFAPLFKKIANVAYQVNKGYSINEILIDQYVIIKNFHKNDDKKSSNKSTFRSFHGLSGKTLYDLVNLYSSLLIHKGSFVKPGMKSPPRSIANIHDSHFGKICPITVSSVNPGEMISLIPENFIDPYGQFLDISK